MNKNTSMLKRIYWKLMYLKLHAPINSFDFINQMNKKQEKLRKKVRYKQEEPERIKRYIKHDEQVLHPIIIFYPDGHYIYKK